MEDEEMTESKLELSVGLFEVISTFLVTLVFYSLCKLKAASKPNLQHKRRTLQRLPSIDQNKIIIAIEIKELLVKCTKKPKPNEQYLPLGKLFYKLLFPKADVCEFIRGLWLISKVQIVLYTSLPPQAVDALLEKFELQDYFPMEMRRFCGIGHSKHTIDIDQNTRRVIILTPPSGNPSNCEKYFLVLEPKPEEKGQLKNWLKKIQELIRDNRSIEKLHDELRDLKYNFDSGEESSHESYEL
jgi:hypothetical protein